MNPPYVPGRNSPMLSTQDHDEPLAGASVEMVRIDSTTRLEMERPNTEDASFSLFRDDQPAPPRGFGHWLRYVLIHLYIC